MRTISDYRLHANSSVFFGVREQQYFVMNEWATKGAGLPSSPLPPNLSFGLILPLGNKVKVN